MIYNGKEVFTEETFEYSKARPGDYVNRAVVDDALDCMPPACMRSDCSQLGEPYSFRIDEDGRTRSTYATFKKVCGGSYEEQVWEFCGYCFRGENVERGKEPIYV